MNKDGLTPVKENVQQPVCVYGIGFGKSAILSNGLALLKKHCSNGDLKELLKDECFPLAIHISFNSKTPFDPTHESNIDLALIRRILASCLGLTWVDAFALPLGDSLRVVDCLMAICTYHRIFHKLKQDQKMLCYFAVDEMNQLVQYIETPQGVKKTDLTCLKKLSKIVQNLSSSSVFVSSLLAGTHFADMTASFLGTGIKPLNLPIT